MAKKSKQQRRLEARRKKQTQQRLIMGAVLVLVAGIAAFLAFGNRSKSPEALASLSAEEAAALPVAPQLGARAPDFTLQDVDGNPVSLSQLSGRPVLMMFFHTW